MAVLSTRYPAVAFALALTTAALSGCAPTPEPSPTPTPAFASEEEAFAAAEEVYRAYIDAFNEVDLRSPETFEIALEYTADDYESSERKSLSEMHAEGYLRGGEMTVVWFEPTAFVNGTTVEARTCDDVSATTFTDSEGNSLVPSDRPDRYALDLVLEMHGDELKLVSSDQVEDESC
ncbi:hypothetical protein ACFY9N_01285 [Microbacterium sp. NPDC008134]|uniref:hypothetical protein n=1 Tax=Microbacterium sp. NPDC008134 TaxID=3364183 RepID=UPI0036EAED3B